jgi:hypothetical protein
MVTYTLMMANQQSRKRKGIPMYNSLKGLTERLQSPMEILGIVSGVILLIAYLLVSKKKVAGDGYIYNGMIFFPSVALLIYAIKREMPAMILLEFVYVPLSFWRLTNAIYKGNLMKRLWKWLTIKRRARVLGESFRLEKLGMVPNSRHPDWNDIMRTLTRLHRIRHGKPPFKKIIGKLGGIFFYTCALEAFGNLKKKE